MNKRNYTELYKNTFRVLHCGKQEKGLSTEEIKEYFSTKKDNLALFKWGVILAAFGIGLGIGLILEDSTGKDFYVPIFLFTITGIGFIAANLTAKKMAVRE